MERGKGKGRKGKEMEKGPPRFMDPGYAPASSVDTLLRTMDWTVVICHASEPRLGNILP